MRVIVGLKLSSSQASVGFIGDGEEAKVGGIVRNANTIRNAGDGHTPDAAELFVNDRLEFSLGDAILQ